MNRNGSSPILVLLCIVTLIGLVGGAYYLGIQAQKDNQPIQQNLNTQSIQPSPSITSTQLKKVISSEKTSPTGDYTVEEKTIGDAQTITIKNKKGEVTTENVITHNEKEIGYGTKILCQCGTSFKVWIDNSHLAIKIVNGGGEEYEYIVDAITGKVDESSFKKIK